MLGVQASSMVNETAKNNEEKCLFYYCCRRDKTIVNNQTHVKEKSEDRRKSLFNSDSLKIDF